MPSLKSVIDSRMAEAAKVALKLKDCQKEATAMGLVLTKTDGEYRINFKGGKEATAYYTDDLEDAMNTGKSMVKRKGSKESAFGPNSDDEGYDDGEPDWKNPDFWLGKDDGYTPLKKGTDLQKFLHSIRSSGINVYKNKKGYVVEHPKYPKLQTAKNFTELRKVLREMHRQITTNRVPKPGSSGKK